MKTLLVSLMDAQTLVAPAPTLPGISGVAAKFNLARGLPYELRVTGPVLAGTGASTSLTDGTPVDVASPLQFEADSVELFVRANGAGDVVATLSRLIEHKGCGCKGCG
jgi:hypothetical protein